MPHDINVIYIGCKGCMHAAADTCMRVRMRATFKRAAFGIELFTGTFTKCELHMVPLSDCKKIDRTQTEYFCQ